jgi:hypothetical protein
VTLDERYVYDGKNLLLVLDGSGHVKARYRSGPAQNQMLAEETGMTSNGAGSVH